MVVILKPSAVIRLLATEKTPLPTPSLYSQLFFGFKKDLIESWLVAASILWTLSLCWNVSNWISSLSILFSEIKHFIMSHDARHSVQDTEGSGSGSSLFSMEAAKASNEGSMGIVVACLSLKFSSASNTLSSTTCILSSISIPFVIIEVNLFSHFRGLRIDWLWPIFYYPLLSSKTHWSSSSDERRRRYLSTVESLESRESLERVSYRTTTT